jgi:hypothetical protein
MFLWICVNQGLYWIDTDQNKIYLSSFYWLNAPALGLIEIDQVDCFRDGTSGRAGRRINMCNLPVI